MDKNWMAPQENEQGSRPTKMLLLQPTTPFFEGVQRNVRGRLEHSWCLDAIPVSFRVGVFLVPWRNLSPFRG